MGFAHQLSIELKVGLHWLDEQEENKKSNFDGEIKSCYNFHGGQQTVAISSK